MEAGTGACGQGKWGRGRGRGSEDGFGVCGWGRRGKKREPPPLPSICHSRLSVSPRLHAILRMSHFQPPLPTKPSPPYLFTHIF